MRRALLLFVLGTAGLLGWATPHLAHAQIQLRTLPAGAKYAVIGAPQPMPYVMLGSTLAKLAPGAVIFDQNNRGIMQPALPQGAKVAFTLDMNGDIQRIYILTHREIAQAK